MFRRFMYGRHGIDRLGFGLAVLLLLLGIVSLFVSGTGSIVLWAIQMLVLGWMLFRMFSRNNPSRAKEDEWFAGKVSAVTKKLSPAIGRMKDREHKYFRCPKCRARLRVPRGRGRITVTCPKCGNKFDKKA